jgi:hypothetical protein
MMRPILAATAALVLCSAAAAQTPPQPSAAQEEASLHGFGDADKTCQEWTDGCRTCTRPESGEAGCSNIGIACQPNAISCTRRAEEKKPEEKK